MLLRLNTHELLILLYPCIQLLLRLFLLLLLPNLNFPLELDLFQLFLFLLQVLLQTHSGLLFLLLVHSVISIRCLFIGKLSLWTNLPESLVSFYRFLVNFVLDQLQFLVNIFGRTLWHNFRRFPYWFWQIHWYILRTTNPVLQTASCFVQYQGFIFNDCLFMFLPFIFQHFNALGSHVICVPPCSSLLVVKSKSLHSPGFKRVELVLPISFGDIVEVI